MSSFWVSISSADLLELDKLGCQPPTETRDKSLSRRLPPGKSGPRPPSFSGSDVGKSPPRPGLDGQCSEIGINSGSQLPISRYCLVSESRPQISSPWKTSRYTSLPSGHSSNPSLVMEDFQGYSGVPEFCCLRGAVRKASSPTDSTGQPSPSPPPTSQTVWDSGSRCLPDSMVVACPSSNISYFPTISSGVRNDRRIKLRMGSCGKHPNIQRNLVGLPDGVAHKSKGDVRGSSGPGVELITSSE